MDNEHNQTMNTMLLETNIHEQNGGHNEIVSHEFS